MKVGALILAGGHSSRMNYPKLWLNTPSGKTFLLQLVQSYLKANVDQVVCVLNNTYGQNEWVEKVQEIPSEVKIVYNEDVNLGRLHSINLGLRHMSEMEYVFIQNVDSPFVLSETLEFLSMNCTDNKIVQPVYNKKKGHPIVIPKNVVNHILTQNQSSHSLRDALSGQSKKFVEVKDKFILSNLNTPESYQKLKSEFV